MSAKPQRDLFEAMRQVKDWLFNDPKRATVCVFSNGVLRYVKNPGQCIYWCEVHHRPADWIRIEDPMYMCDPNLAGITMPCRVLSWPTSVICEELERMTQRQLINKVKEIFTQLTNIKAELKLWEEAFPDNELHPKQLAEEGEKLLAKNAALTKEVEQLSRAFELKLDAAPSGLSAGQSRVMHDHLLKLYYLLRAAGSHIPASSMAGSLPADIKTELGEVERLYNLPTPGTEIS